MRRDGGPRLPAPAHYARLPEPFDAALQRARSGLREGNSDGVRGLARLYQANRLYNEARACYRVIASNPGGLSARDHYYLAAIALDESDLATGQAELRATLLSEPEYVPARVALAEALFKDGQADEAETQYAAILKSEADHPKASLGMARIELQRGNEDAAVARLRDLVAHHPESTSAAALLAQILGRRGQADEAAAMTALSKQTHEPVPPDPWMKALRGDCYDQQRLALDFEEYRLTGQIDEALPLLGRLEELDPKGWIPPMLHGWSQKQAGNYPEAVRQFRLSLENGGDPEKICPFLAATQLRMGSPADAAAMLEKYHAMLPHSVPILLSYCEVSVKMKDEKLARTLLTEVLRLEPYLYMPNMSLVAILWKSGEHDAAAQCLLRVAKVFPSDVDSRGFLGQYYLEKADPWSAIAPLEQAMGHAQDARRTRIRAMLDTAYLTAGSLEAAHGHMEAAVGYSEKSIRLFPEGLRGYALKANVCKHMKDFKGAAEAMGRMAQLKPDDPAIRMGLGDLVYLSGDHDGARAQWQRALQLAPPDDGALRSLLGSRLSGQVSASTLQ